jgi:subfamily B ATP-binding cassette protein MsbA
MISVFKKIWPEIRPYKKNVWLVISLGLFTSGFKSIVPEMFGMLTKSWAAETRDTKMALIIPVVIAVCWLISSVARFYHLFYMKFTADLVTINLRRKLMDKYLSMELSFLQNFERGSGGLIARMLNDVSIVQSGIHRLADVFREPVVVIGMLGYLIYKEWKLTLFIMIALPIVTGVLRSLARSLRKYSKQNQEIVEDLTRTLKESLDGARIVQSFCLEDELRKKFNSQAEQFIRTRKKIIGREEAAGPISESITAFFIAAVLVYVGYLIFNTNFTQDSFMSYMVGMAMLQDGIRKLQDGYIKLQQGAVGVTRLYEILDSHPKLKEPTVPTPFPQNWQDIEFNNIEFSYGTEKILNNVSLKVNRNEVVALVGSSGSGKTTLVNLLQRFFDPANGEVKIGGVSIQDISLHNLRKNIALVTQDVFLFNDTIEKNILMGNLDKNITSVVEAAKMANAHNFVTQTPNGYNTNVGDFGSRMSGGEKQRISIARAILKDAPILVLDEATSALDSESELEVQKGLQKLLQGRTAFVIAHRLSTIASADRIIVMRKGEIVETGTHQELLAKKGEYFKFYQMQYQPELLLPT